MQVQPGIRLYYDPNASSLETIEEHMDILANAEIQILEAYLDQGELLPEEMGYTCQPTNDALSIICNEFAPYLIKVTAEGDVPAYIKLEIEHRVPNVIAETKQ
ncbi:hypothetical protein K492DRAFT_173783 [Lichtheimia hyalospora FSU 10163]|nr:hypothetical protein K492DRAFT_173783 [Lichtheimia hyalospora FSU 10163]